jgi:hypothetical protein
MFQPLSFGETHNPIHMTLPLLMLMLMADAWGGQHVARPSLASNNCQLTRHMPAKHAKQYLRLSVCAGSQWRSGDRSSTIAHYTLVTLDLVLMTNKYSPAGRKYKYTVATADESMSFFISANVTFQDAASGASRLAGRGPLIG